MYFKCLQVANIFDNKGKLKQILTKIGEIRPYFGVLNFD